MNAIELLQQCCAEHACKDCPLSVGPNRCIVAVRPEKWDRVKIEDAINIKYATESEEKPRKRRKAAGTTLETSEPTEELTYSPEGGGEG